MLVAADASVDPTLEEISVAIAAGRRAVLLAGAPGVGKTSVLAAASKRIGSETGRSVVWLSGGLIASEGHLAYVVSRFLREPGIATVTSGAAPDVEDVFQRLATDQTRSHLLAIDDFDTLIFKREHVANVISATIAAGPSVCLVATCHPSVCVRLTTVHHFARNLAGYIATITLPTLGVTAARELVYRRAPCLPDKVISAVVKESGGHPAALVYLARLAELRFSNEPRFRPSDLANLLERAAEFAGTVYAESWASLGPQQRAILWQLGSSVAPATAGEIALKILLPASHVSAQLKRLMEEGLVYRSAPRAHYTVAPLFARWIARRAVGEHNQN